MSIYERGNAKDTLFDRTVPVSGRVMTDFEPHSPSQVDQDLLPYVTPEPKKSQKEEYESLYTPEQQKLINNLFKSGCMQFGNLTLNSGGPTFYKLDLAHAQHDPSLQRMISSAYANVIREHKPDIISPVPSASVPTITLVAQELGLPMTTVRIKELDKNTGKFVIDGLIPQSVGHEAIVADDAGTTGDSILKAVKALRGEGVKVKRALVLLDRQEGALENLAREDVELLSVFKARPMFEYSLSAVNGMKKPIINDQQRDLITAYLKQY